MYYGQPTQFSATFSFSKAKIKETLLLLAQQQHEYKLLVDALDLELRTMNRSRRKRGLEKRLEKKFKAISHNWLLLNWMTCFVPDGDDYTIELMINGDVDIVSPVADVAKEVRARCKHPLKIMSGSDPNPAPPEFNVIDAWKSIPQFPTWLKKSKARNPWTTAGYFFPYKVVEKSKILIDRFPYRKGGWCKSEAKIRAAKENLRKAREAGKLGGRPRKPRAKASDGPYKIVSDGLLDETAQRLGGKSKSKAKQDAAKENLRKARAKYNAMGRPRKHTPVEEGDVEEDVEPKKRGRPKKVVVMPKKRGRPKTVKPIETWQTRMNKISSTSVWLDQMVEEKPDDE
jgi:hypothetical protein